MADARRIVNFRDERAVCCIATVQEPPGLYDLPDEPIEHYQAWVFGQELAVLCRVGQKEATYPLPSWEPKSSSFFGDRFPFAIDSRSCSPKRHTVASEHAKSIISRMPQSVT
jgi:hypothetical protein